MEFHPCVLQNVILYWVHCPAYNDAISSLGTWPWQAKGIADLSMHLGGLFLTKDSEHHGVISSVISSWFCRSDRNLFLIELRWRDEEMKRWRKLIINSVAILANDDRGSDLDSEDLSASRIKEADDFADSIFWSIFDSKWLAQIRAALDTQNNHSFLIFS